MIRFLSRIIITTSILLILSPFTTEAKSRIVIRNQNDLFQINALIKQSIEGGDKDIEVIIRPGNYHFTDNLLLLEHVKCPNITICIKGCGVKMISSGDIYKTGDRYNKNFSDNNSFVTNNGARVPVWSKVKWAEGLIEVVDENTVSVRTLGLA